MTGAHVTGRRSFLVTGGPAALARLALSIVPFVVGIVMMIQLTKVS